MALASSPRRGLPVPHISPTYLAHISPISRPHLRRDLLTFLQPAVGGNDSLAGWGVDWPSGEAVGSWYAANPSANTNPQPSPNPSLSLSLTLSPPLPATLSLTLSLSLSLTLTLTLGTRPTT